MHATYCFLMSVDPTLDHEENASDMESMFEEYADDYGDENNWYQAMAVVFPDGEVINLVEGTDWRGRDEFAGEIDKENAWEYAIDMARKCVLSEVSSALEYLTRDYDTPIRFKDHQDMIDQLVDAIKLGVDTLKHNKEFGSVYSVVNAAEKIGQLKEMSEDYPFTTDIRNPYESIRALDLRQNDGPERAEYGPAILFADMHT